MAESLRIFGGELGVARGYVDADIGGVTLDGAIELVDQDTGDTWSIDPERISDLADERLLYDLSTVETAAVEWGAIDSLETAYKNDSDQDRAHFVAAARTVFKGAQ